MDKERGLCGEFIAVLLKQCETSPNYRTLSRRIEDSLKNRIDREFEMAG
jgi:hypothetical protein